MAVLLFDLLYLFPVLVHTFVIKPSRLYRGDTVGFISPASPPYYIYNASTYKEHVIQSMAQWNLSVKFGPHSFEEWGYLAGHDRDRAADVMAMWKDPTVKMIVANRGGYGCARILDLLDYDFIRSHPKPFMGYSDLTALLNAIHFKTGLVTFHGPMGIENWTNLNGVYFQNVLLNAQTMKYTIADGYNYTTVKGGKARGRLVGGNLTVFTSIVGSAFMYNNFENTILFLEDVHADPMDVDRFFTQLHLAGILNKVSGIVWGRCTDCEPDNPQRSFQVEEIVYQKLKAVNVPSFIGAMIGHISQYYLLPIGVMAEIDADKAVITMLEAAVV